MPPINNFDVLKRMSSENKRVWLAPTIIEMKYNARKGSELTFGVEGNVLFDIRDGKKQAVCLLWSVEEFEQVKRGMEKEAAAAEETTHGV